MMHILLNKFELPDEMISQVLPKLNKYSTLLRACTIELTLTECNYVYHVVFLACKSGTLRVALHNVWQYNGKKHNKRTWSQIM